MAEAPNFTQFKSFFPEVELPVLLGETTHLTFSRLNKPLPGILIFTFLQSDEIDDEYTEYLPCLSFKVNEDVHGLVYWKAGLLYYDYHLLTFNKDGVQIEDLIIAGIQANGNQIRRTIAHIEHDLNIYTISANQKDETMDIHLEETEQVKYTILDTGQVIKMAI